MVPGGAGCVGVSRKPQSVEPGLVEGRTGGLTCVLPTRPARSLARKNSVELGRGRDMIRRMKRILMVGIFLLPGLALVAADRFWEQLTPEERAAAGLDRLTAVQQAELDRLAERFVREGARQAVEVAKAEAKAEVEQQVKQREEERFGLFKAQDKVEGIRSRIAGTFKGWSGKTLFRLENGQVWVQADASDTYWVPAQPGPEVEVRESGIGGWKLYLLPNERWVRVRRAN